MNVLGTWCPDDAVLGTVAPLALAASAGTALVIDLDTGRDDYRAAGTLAEMVREGPRRRRAAAEAEGCGGPRQRGSRRRRRRRAHRRPRRRLAEGGAPTPGRASSIGARGGPRPSAGARTPSRTDPGRLSEGPVGSGAAASCPRAPPSAAGNGPQPPRGQAAGAVGVVARLEAGLGAPMAVIDRLVERMLDTDVPLERTAVEEAVRRLLPEEAPLATPEVAVRVADALVGLGPLEPLLGDPIDQRYPRQRRRRRVGGARRVAPALAGPLHRAGIGGGGGGARHRPARAAPRPIEPGGRRSPA